MMVVAQEDYGIVYLTLRGECSIHAEIFLYEDTRKLIAHFNTPHVVKSRFLCDDGEDCLKEDTEDSSTAEIIICDTTLPLTIADKIPQDKPVSDDVVLDLVGKYDLPRDSNKFLREKQSLYLEDGSQVLAIYPLDTLKAQLVDIKATVLLWQAVIECDHRRIRRLFNLRHNDGISAEYMPISTSFYKNLPSTFDQSAFDSEEEEAKKFASQMLCEMVRDGLEDFPLSSTIEVAEEGRFRHIPQPLDSFSYAWTVILNDLSRSDARRKWHYKKCKGYQEKVDGVWENKPCDVWEDLSKPNRRATRWTRCDKCKYEYQKEKSQRKRDKERAQDPNRRGPGRPKKAS
jgi:hypothetical protein